MFISYTRGFYLSEVCFLAFLLSVAINCILTRLSVNMAAQSRIIDPRGHAFLSRGAQLSSSKLYVVVLGVNGLTEGLEHNVLYVRCRDTVPSFSAGCD